MKQRVLVIDDQEEIAFVLKDFLDAHGIDVDVALSGREAVAKMQKSRFDVLVTDFKLPDLNGLVVAKMGKRIFPTLKIIFVTGYKMELPIMDREIGADYQILEKPCRPKTILHAIESMTLPSK